MDGGGNLQLTYSKGKALMILRVAELAWLSPHHWYLSVFFFFFFFYKFYIFMFSLFIFPRLNLLVFCWIFF